MTPAFAPQGADGLPQFERGGCEQAAPGHGRGDTDRGVGGDGGVRAAGELVEQQLGPCVGEGDVDLLQRQVEFLGDQHRAGGGDALADLGPRQGEGGSAVAVEPDGDQVRRGQRGVGEHVVEVVDLGGAGQRGDRRGGLAGRQDRLAQGCGDGERRRGDHIAEEAASAEAVGVGAGRGVRPLGAVVGSHRQTSRRRGVRPCSAAPDCARPARVPEDPGGASTRNAHNRLTCEAPGGTSPDEPGPAPPGTSAGSAPGGHGAEPAHPPAAHSVSHRSKSAS